MQSFHLQITIQYKLYLVPIYSVTNKCSKVKVKNLLYREERLYMNKSTPRRFPHLLNMSCEYMFTQTNVKNIKNTHLYIYILNLF